MFQSILKKVFCIILSIDYVLDILFLLRTSREPSMKKSMIAVTLVMLAIIVTAGYYGINYYNQDTELRISTTTSVDNTGLLQLLIDKFSENTGINVSVIAKGSGTAVDLGRKGDVDAILVHAPSLEQTLIDEGYGVNRTTLWYNYFIIVGPANDPAGIAHAVNATDAFQRIYDTKSTFYSRGDNSGTHVKELGIWNTVPDAAVDTWYIETGTGMSATLTTANENLGYVLTDIGTYAKMRGNDQIKDLEILFEKDDLLYNPYSYMVINPEKYADLHTENAYKFLDFLKSDEAKDIVRKLVVGNVQLFNIVGE